MKKVTMLCAAMLAATLAPIAFAAKEAHDPHAVAPHSADWVCAQNTSQLAQGFLKDAGLIDPAKVDDRKTEMRLLLKKSFGGGRYEQVFYLVLHQNDGKSINLIAQSTTESDGECPGSGIKVFVVSHELGEWPTHDWVFPPK
jgi:hypothetical protein